ncbi:MAG: serine/threonine protein kinase [Verrucomicrobiae bacterium]|nr:serine/threonine protein kinase [Verrucomicrobiae bacterium]
MSNSNREKELFEHAVELDSPAERAGFLKEACGADLDLRQRVEALLAVSDAAAGFLPGQPGGARDPSSAEGVVGKTIAGRYKVLEPIGEGGFGVVYMAEQTAPIRRRVALKIIKPGMDSRQVIGRFEAERQALAMMNDPNIAQVLDAGATEKGHPFFVMELVRGIPITQFCAERELDLEARLTLFVKVCSAVQHAHQKGIIHRDLKPANILVTLHGEEPVPKVIDFGIAKAMHEPLTDKTLFTHFQQFLGTPAYMSPEQASLSGLDVDTRSDIYSLGVLLYELVTGGPPFDAKSLLGSGWEAMRKTLCEREPERPSTRLRRATHGAANVRGIRCHARLARELDLIVLKALEKDRERRYPTANGLAADVRRFLQQEPVTAMPPSLTYQLAKLGRRHRKAVVTGMAFGVVLLMAALTGTGLAIRARQAETVAIREAEAARNVSEFLWKELLRPLTPWSHTNPGVSLKAAFDAASDSIPARLQGQPLAEAAIRLSFARAHLGLAEWDRAETNLMRALALQRAHAGTWDERTADVLFQAGTLREFQSRWVDAEAAFEEAAAIRAQIFGPDHPEPVVARAKAALNRARQLPADRAEPVLSRASEDLMRFVGAAHHVHRSILNRLGELHLKGGRPEQAWDLFEQTRRLAQEEEGDLSSGVLWSLELKARTRAHQGRYAEADHAFQEVEALRKQTLRAGHDLTLKGQLLRTELVLVPQRRFEEAATVLLDLADVAVGGQSTVRAEWMGTLEAVLSGWQEHGGGPEFETFRDRALSYLAAPTAGGR